MLDKIDAFFAGDRRAVRVLLVILMINVAIFGSILLMEALSDSASCGPLCLDEIRQQIEGIVGADGNQFDPREGLDETLDNP